MPMHGAKSARSPGAAPQYNDFFSRGSLRGLWREGHPYAFAETYTLMRHAFGYESHYVNFGYWSEGLQTQEAGRQMTMLMGEALRLPRGGRLLEGGSGLGQTAVDLCETFQLSEVTGMNPCVPQVNFANALAAHRGLGERVRHRICNATEEIFTFEEGAYDGGIAVECIGIFPDPGRYLKGLRRALRPGGRVAFTVVSTPQPAGWLQHRLSRLFFGTEARPPAWWIERLTEAGFVDIQRQDITQEVFPPMIATVRQNLRQNPELINVAGPFVAKAIQLLIRHSERNVSAGTMGYDLYSASAP